MVGGNLMYLKGFLNLPDGIENENTPPTALLLCKAETILASTTTAQMARHPG